MEQKKVDSKRTAVRFTGIERGIHERVISPSDWDNVPLEVVADAPDRQARLAVLQELRWDKSNNWTLYRDEMAFLSDAEFDRYIAGDDGFEVSQS